MNVHRPISSVVAPRPLLLSDFTTLRREAVRPAEFRRPDFDAKFDADTMFFDVFRMTYGRVMLSGPPLFNLKPTLEALRIRSLPSGTICRFRLREMERHMRLVVDAPAEDRSLELETPAGRIEIAIGKNLSDRFAGRRVLFTLSRNNQLNWIADWIRFARDRHGADAVLIYDNRSTLYSAEQLRDSVAAIPGIAALEVVDWPFRYGPQGLDARRFWDSDFCQLGAWEHARWRFLQKARSAQNADIDELVVSPTGESVFDAAERDPFGIVRYRGRWVMGVAETEVAPNDPNRGHADYDTVLKVQPGRRFGVLPVDTASCPPKWTIVPSRVPERAQWAVHSILGWLPSRRTSKRFSFRHFRELSDSWKYARGGRAAFDPQTHEIDDLLQRELSAVRTK